MRAELRLHSSAFGITLDFMHTQHSTVALGRFKICSVRGVVAPLRVKDTFTVLPPALTTWLNVRPGEEGKVDCWAVQTRRCRETCKEQWAGPLRFLPLFRTAPQFCWRLG
jgi:hypothetical protein